MAKFALICVVVFCANGVLSVPVQEPQAVPAEGVPVEVAENQDGAAPSKEDSSKFFRKIMN